MIKEIVESVKTSEIKEAKQASGKWIFQKSSQENEGLPILQFNEKSWDFVATILEAENGFYVQLDVEEDGIDKFKKDFDLAQTNGVLAYGLDNNVTFIEALYYACEKLNLETPNIKLIKEYLDFIGKAV